MQQLAAIVDGLVLGAQHPIHAWTRYVYMARRDTGRLVRCYGPACCRGRAGMGASPEIRHDLQRQSRVRLAVYIVT